MAHSHGHEHHNGTNMPPDPWMGILLTISLIMIGVSWYYLFYQGYTHVGL